ncbi:HD domain-containing protein [Roseibium porphyridii]|uniref:HD domain-containing protein n=1 Tax=Roseibium porphyridii TaxID=2866279 RepID=A0ABY8F3D1_9HYPH|nr:HD domain-containing phosphohydrolase [Roseibium sp. KMA01]WFE89866.1 HD domain-containing protein [Roseibium sp. KMA01]
MRQIYLVAAEFRKPSRLYFEISSTYPAQLVQVDNLDAQVRNSDFVIVDFLGLTTKHIQHLKLLSARTKFSLIGVLDTKNRQHILQARSLECKKVIDRSKPFAALLLELRPLLGDYSHAEISSECSVEMEKAVVAACSSFAQLSTAALIGADLPFAKLKNGAEELASAIKAEGLNAWLSAVELHHSHTFCHTMMVAGHAAHLSMALDLDSDEQFLLTVGALVHDLGKIKIPLSILDKPAKLSSGERNLINKHPIHSRNILRKCNGVPTEIFEMAVSHHEILDGSGYTQAAQC